MGVNIWSHIFYQTVVHKVKNKFNRQVHSNFYHGPHEKIFLEMACKKLNDMMKAHNMI